MNLSFRRILYWTLGVAICGGGAIALKQLAYSPTYLTHIVLDFDEIYRGTYVGAGVGAVIGWYKGRY